MKRGNEMKTPRGISFIEVIVSVAIVSILLPVVGIVFYNLFVTPPDQGARLTINNEISLLSSMLSNDAHLAENFTAGNGKPYYGNFTWTDYSVTPSQQYIVSYYATNPNCSNTSCVNNIARIVNRTNTSATPTPTPTPTATPAPTTTPTPTPSSQTYTFCSGGGTDKWAWSKSWTNAEWFTQGRPTNPDNFFDNSSYNLMDADANSYSKLCSIDNNSWINLDTTPPVDYGVSSQLYQIAVNQNISAVTNLSVTWRGYGGAFTQNTKLKIWNYTGSSWYTLVNLSDPGNKTIGTYINNITTNPSYYINASTGSVTLLASSDTNNVTPENTDFGTALYFNGSNSSKVTTSSTVPTNTFTFEAWVKATEPHEIDAESTSSTSGTSGQHWVFGAYHRDNSGTYAGAGLSVGTNGISVYEHSDGYMPPLAVYTGSVGTAWNHIAVVYNSKTPSIYLNGNLVRTGLTSPETTVYAPFEIGSGDYGAFSGAIDEVRIWNVARTQAEIRANMYKEITSPTANLIGYWKFNNCSTDVLDGIMQDSSTYNNNGTLSSPPPQCTDSLERDVTVNTDYIALDVNTPPTPTPTVAPLPTPLATVAFSSTPAGSIWTPPAGVSSVDVLVVGGGGAGGGVSGGRLYTSGGGGGAGGVIYQTGYAITPQVLRATFTSSGSWVVPDDVTSVEVLVVAGGGAGGSGYWGGGGGAGGVIYNATYAVTPGATMPVTVGNGGSAGNSGGNSVFGTITATGGGRGQGSSSVQNGGSGGGGGSQSSPEGTVVGTGTAGQGNNGGTGVSGLNSGNAGGGGGAGAAGSNATSSVSGNGGIGVSSAISGTATYYGGGGGGGAENTGETAGTGGQGGGGNGGKNSNGGAGTANTGGGGGGSGTSGHSGGAGGSGIVIVKYTTSAVTVTVGAGGTGVSANVGGSGENSVFATLTASGGGGGGSGGNGNPSTGANGGSGGGGGGRTETETDYASGSGTSGQGNSGGSSRSDSSCCWYGEVGGGGGGGAGGAGQNAVDNTPGNGGAGVDYNSIFGNVGGLGNGRFAGGGGGANEDVTSTPGYGGGAGGTNSNLTGNAGIANTGGGGGGAYMNCLCCFCQNQAGASGGSGFIVLRYTIPYKTLNVSSSAGGTVTTPTPPGANYVAGTVASIVAVPNQCYQFVNWTGDTGTIANVNTNSTTITMNNNYTIHANFIPSASNYSLSLNASPYAGGSPFFNGSSPFACGYNVSIHANPDTGYYFQYWTGIPLPTGIANANASDTTVQMTANRSLTAVYSLSPVPSPTATPINYLTTMYLTWHITANNFSLSPDTGTNLLTANMTAGVKTSMGKYVQKQLTLYLQTRPLYLLPKENIWGDDAVSTLSSFLISGDYNSISGDVKVNGTVTADAAAEKNAIDGNLYCPNTNPDPMPTARLSFTSRTNGYPKNVMPDIGTMQSYFTTNLSAGVQVLDDGLREYVFTGNGTVYLHNVNQVWLGNNPETNHTLKPGTYYSPGTIELDDTYTKGSVTFIANKIVINNNNAGGLITPKITLGPFQEDLLFWANASGANAILIQGTSAWHACASLEGVMFAPNGEIDLQGSGRMTTGYIDAAELYNGALVAKDLTISGSHWNFYRW